MATKKATTKDATATLEETLGKAQEQFLGAVEQGQTLVLEGYKTMIDGLAQFDLPTVPGLADMYRLRSDMFDQAFGFGIAMLESQRDFAKKVLEVATDSQS